MKIVFFVHAITSCWNNGNAHFLRGLGRSLAAMGHEIVYAEAKGNWSESNLLSEQGAIAFSDCRAATADLKIERYEPRNCDLAQLTADADLVIVHEWNEPSLVARLGKLRKKSGRFTLLFHDTHHRAVTAPDELGRNDLSGFDGVLAFGEAIAKIYRQRGWGARSFVFHEAADTRLYFPREMHVQRDLVWIGNWGDEERTSELREFLISPSSSLQLAGAVHGVRYPANAKQELAQMGLDYCGWLPNHAVPLAFARARFTMHVPRRPYVRALPGIPTIRVFEALACGTPLISAPWDDCENLFSRGCFLLARDGSEAREHMRALVQDDDMRSSLREKGLAEIRARHTCDHRARELLEIHASISNPLPEKDVA